jgi:hypothetical protein
MVRLALGINVFQHTVYRILSMLGISATMGLNLPKEALLWTREMARYVFSLKRRYLSCFSPETVNPNAVCSHHASTLTFASYRDLIYCKDTNVPSRRSNTTMTAIFCLPHPRISYHRYGEPTMVSAWARSTATRVPYGAWIVIASLGDCLQLRLTRHAECG